MKKQKKNLILPLLLTGLLFGGCSSHAAQSSAEDNTDLIVVGFSQVGAESDWRNANTRSMQEALTAENGYRLILEDAQQKQEKQPSENRNNYYLKQKEYKAALAAARQEITKQERAIEENERAQARTESDIAQAEARGDFEAMQRLCVALGQLQSEESQLYEALERAEKERAQLEKEGEA